MNVLGKQTTINFDGDLRMNYELRNYTESDVFTIVRQLKSGMFVLVDKDGKEVHLAKKHIELFFQDE